MLKLSRHKEYGSNLLVRSTGLILSLNVSILGLWYLWASCFHHTHAISNGNVTPKYGQYGMYNCGIGFTVRVLVHIAEWIMNLPRRRNRCIVSRKGHIMTKR